MDATDVRSSQYGRIPDVCGRYAIDELWTLQVLTRHCGSECVEVYPENSAQHNAS